MAELLLVEDDAEIRRALIRSLGDRGHVVRSEPTGMSGLQAIIDHRPALVILDLGLPDIDGEDLLRMVRAVSQVPIVVVTARNNEATIVNALRNGADDYLVKPFGPDELDARIEAVLRRTSGGQRQPEPPVLVGELRIDPAAREVTLRGEALELTPREFDLLAYLASRAGAVVPRRELLTQVWRQAYGGPDDTIDVHLSWLRRKLGESAQQPRYLHTVRGVGVKLSPPEVPAS
jgi:DNA-binding response OmpR family regulator